MYRVLLSIYNSWQKFVNTNVSILKFISIPLFLTFIISVCSLEKFQNLCSSASQKPSLKLLFNIFTFLPTYLLTPSEARVCIHNGLLMCITNVLLVSCKMELTQIFFSLSFFFTSKKINNTYQRYRWYCEIRSHAEWCYMCHFYFPMHYPLPLFCYSKEE